MLRHGMNVESVMYTDASKVLSAKVFNRCLVVVGAMVVAEVDATALNEFPYPDVGNAKLYARTQQSLGVCVL